MSASLLLSAEESNEGVIDAECFGALKLPPLVVLTACSSGRGTQRWGDAATSDLSGIALRAGATTVLLPHARLEFESTRELSRHFHRHLVTGISPAKALQKARRAVSKISKFDDPFYYALLHVHGRGHRAHFSEPRPLPSSDEERHRIVWLALLIIATLFGGLVWWRRRR